MAPCLKLGVPAEDVVGFVAVDTELPGAADVVEGSGTVTTVGPAFDIPVSRARNNTSRLERLTEVAAPIALAKLLQSE